MFILAINPGTTSTKMAVFQDDKMILEEKIEHSAASLQHYKNIFEQYDYRLNLILNVLKINQIDLRLLNAVVGRGGLLKPIEGGTYTVNQTMLNDLKNAIRGQHASNLGAVLAHGIAEPLGIPSYIVDPVAVDELEPVARVSGLPDFQRESLLHTLNHKAVARKVAKEMGKKYEELNFVVAHLGTGTSIAAHKKGRAIDLNDARGEGPFSLERCGGVNAYDMMRLCFSGKYTENELTEKMYAKGGVYAHLGTKDIREVQKMADSGDERAKLVLEAMIYQVAKEIGAQAAVLYGDVNRIILTGGMAYSHEIVDKIAAMVKFIAPIEVVPGEEELKSLYLGALRVLNGEETAKIYT